MVIIVSFGGIFVNAHFILFYFIFIISHPIFVVFLAK